MTKSLEIISRHFFVLLFLDTFRIKRILSFLLFFDTFLIQGMLLFLLFPDTFGTGWKVRRLESWKVGRLDGQKVGRLESWNIQRVLLFPQVTIADRAERRRREARHV